MPVVAVQERYDFSRSTRDPDKSFPAFMESLKSAYTDYDLVWDRQKNRWLCIRWLSWPGKTKMIALEFLQHPDGTLREPDMAFIDELKATDVRSRAVSIEAFIAQLMRDQESTTANLEAELDEDFSRRSREFLSYIERMPHSVAMRNVGGWRARHIAQVNYALQESRRSQGEPTPCT